MDTKKLRRKILDLAIHGKLVPQDPNDEPASVLLERIRAEKEALIKEGKIKAPKGSRACDMSYYKNVPEGWTICALADLCEIRGGKRIPKGKSFTKDKTPYVYIRVTDMKKQTILLDDLKYIDSEVHEEIKNYIISSNDLYLTIAGTIGAVGVVPKCLDGMNLTENAARLTNIKCAKTYLMYALLATSSQEHFSFKFHQVAQPKLSIEAASSTPILLPPLNEQNRIIKEISRIWNIIDSLEQATTLLQKDISQTKQTILSLAISGKLVPQDPSDEPAINLLKRINPSFKPCDNSQYEKDIPEAWCLARLGDVAEYGDTTNVAVSSIEEGDWVLELEDIEKDTAAILDRKTKAEREINGVRHSFKRGQILYSKLRTYLNKVLIAPDNGFCTTEIVPITAGNAVLPDYLLTVLRSPYFMEYTASCGYGVKMPRLGTNDAKKAVIPIPPLTEQKRIVSKIQEAFDTLDSISGSLN